MLAKIWSDIILEDEVDVVPKDGVHGAEFASRTTMNYSHFMTTKWPVLGSVQQAILRP
jgi:hypothetical protein